MPTAKRARRVWLSAPLWRARTERRLGVASGAELLVELKRGTCRVRRWLRSMRRGRSPLGSRTAASGEPLSSQSRLRFQTRSFGVVGDLRELDSIRLVERAAIIEHIGRCDPRRHALHTREHSAGSLASKPWCRAAMQNPRRPSIDDQSPTVDCTLVMRRVERPQSNRVI